MMWFFFEDVDELSFWDFVNKIELFAEDHPFVEVHVGAGLGDLVEGGVLAFGDVLLAHVFVHFFEEGVFLKGYGGIW